MFSYSFDESVISYGTAVAYMAYCFMQLGLNNTNTSSRVRISINNTALTQLSQRKLKKGLSFLSFVFAVSLLYFLLNGGTGYFSDQFIYSMSEQDRFMGYVVQFINPIAMSIIALAFMLPNKKCFAFYFSIALLLVYIAAILSTGSRTYPLAMIIMAMFMYNDHVKKISAPKLAILGLAFLVVMVLAGSLRGSGELITTQKISAEASEALTERSENAFSFANELIICNRNLYYLISSTDKVSYTFGITILGYFLGMVPFLPSLFMAVTGVPEYLLNSALYNTVLSTGPNYTKGLGTHAVADIYICWGIIGVILIFYFYGYLITKLKSKGNLYATIAYYVIVSNAVYACRASIFNLRAVLWTIIVVYIVMQLTGQSQKAKTITNNV